MKVDVLFPIALRHSLSYRTTEEVEVGAFVRAPIGNRTSLGIITATHKDDQSVEKLKFITSVETHIAPISAKRLELWRWISEYYLCTMGEVMKASTLAKPPRATHCTVLPPTGEGGVTVLKGAHGRMAYYNTLISQTLLLGKSVLFLTPEHQPQMPKGVQTLPLHSRLTPAQKRKTVQIITEHKKPAVIIGARSALLLSDMQHFGLIIVDEEHDFSYKQIDPAPRFHARDLALFMGKHYQIPVILGSASPSLESEYHIRTGKYRLLSLTLPMPPQPKPNIIDTLRLRKKKQMNGSFSAPLLRAMEESLAQKKQVLLISLHCHQLLEEAKSIFKETNLFIGSHSIYKNIDWQNIGVAAIFDTDRLLSRADFRAYERTHQSLITLFTKLPQNSTPVFIQTDRSDLPFYRHLESKDSEDFILEQLRERKEYHYPPFVRLIAIRCKHKNREKALTTVQQCKEDLSAIGFTLITGPFEPIQAEDPKIHTQLLWIHLQRHTDTQILKKRLYEKTTTYKGMVQIDVDPY